MRRVLGLGGTRGQVPIWLSVLAAVAIAPLLSAI
jgi:hypothetical protein